MSQVRTSSKPTLGLLLSNPQSEDSPQKSHQRILFPKINTKLKKTHATKYRSAFINAKSCDIYLQSEPSELLSSEVLKNKGQQSPKASSSVSKVQKCKSKCELNQKLWRVNNKKDKSYSVRVPERLTQSRILFLSQLEQSRQKNELLNSRSFDENEGSKCGLLTEIRNMDVSPIKYSSSEKQQRQYLRNSQQINENIQRSNHIISLIEKNYKKGFFKGYQNGQKRMNQLQSKLGLFAYLKRDFVTKKQTLSPERVIEYFKKPSNKKLQAKIDFEARSFLKHKLQSDYHSHSEVERLRGQLSQRAIEQCKIQVNIYEELKQKNVAFHKEYSKKYNIPYLSFLSLPRQMKVKVLQNMTRQSKQQRAK